MTIRRLLVLLAAYIGASITVSLGWITYAVHRSLPGGYTLPAPRWLSRWQQLDGEASINAIELSIFALSFLLVAVIAAAIWFAIRALKSGRSPVS